MTGPETGELRGVLAEGVLAELLRTLFLDKRTGVLHLAFGAERSDIGLHEGFLIHAVTTLPGARLGDLLVQIGFLSTNDRDACLEIAALSKERLGESLLRRGLLDSESLAQGLALQLREVVARIICWPRGVYTFRNAPMNPDPSAQGFLAPRLDPREVLLDATWTLVSDPAIDELLGDLGRRLQPAKDKRLLNLDFRLTPSDAFLLSRVEGLLTAEQLLDQSTVPIDEAKASLAGLLAVGAIEYVGVPPATSRTQKMVSARVARLAGRINSADPFEVLDVRPDLSGDQLRSAYLNLLKSCDPAATTDPQLRPVLIRMCEQLAEAFREIERRRGASGPIPISRLRGRDPTTSSGPLAETPKPPIEPASAQALPLPQAQGPPPGSRVDPSLAHDAAAQAFEQGRAYEALGILHDAIPHLKGRARRLARVKKAKILLSVENGAKLAEEELKLAIGEDPGNPEAHAVLGGIYRERGSLALAMMEYRKALELEPRNVAAREGLQELRGGPAEPAPMPSVLKRLFSRPSE